MVVISQPFSVRPEVKLDRCGHSVGSMCDTQAIEVVRHRQGGNHPEPEMNGDLSVSSAWSV
jgi:hypothetical protein